VESLQLLELVSLWNRRMSVLETPATALAVPLAELAAEAPVVAAEEPPGAGGLRLVLSGPYALRAMLGSSNRAPAISTLRSKTRKAWELTHAGRYTALYEIAAAVDLGDAGRALRAAATVDTTGLSAERRASMLIDVARAHAQRRQVHAAGCRAPRGRGDHP
jgi:hypothetical protein